MKYTAADLDFKKLEEPETPIFRCNCCGKQEPAYGWFVADIDISEDAKHMTIVCSEKCIEDFKSHPFADSYLNQEIKNSISLNQSNP